MPDTGTREKLEDLPEKVLVALAINRELAAMEELIRRQHRNVRNFMLRLCGHWDEAEDLSQQVFLRVWQSIPSLRSANAYYGWQKQVMLNVWKESLRRRKIQLSSVDEQHIDELAATDKSPRLGMDLENALAQLTPPMRVCVVLAYHEGMTYPEIAELTGMPVGTIKSNVSRGTAKLKTLLAGYTARNERDGGT